MSDEKVDQKFTNIFFHLETTGYEIYDEVIQIQLLSKQFGTLELYIIPTVDPEYRAINNNNFKVCEGQLYKNGELINDDPCEQMEAWDKFADFVLKHDNPILICHNISFHGRFLRQEIEKTPVAEKLAEVHIVDLLPICRRMLPELEKHTLEHLAVKVKNLEYDSTNSEMKVFLLKSLFKHMEVTQEQLHYHKNLMQDYLSGIKKSPNKRKSPYPPTPTKKSKKSLDYGEEVKIA